MFQNKDAIQLVNTAIIKNKERQIESSYEERLNRTCDKPAVKAISIAISHLAESQKISYDQAALDIVETVKELEKIWSDYINMEGINNLKSLLKDKQNLNC